MPKPEDELIDSKVSSSQCTLAINALLKHALKHKSEKEQNELLPEKDQFVWLVLTTKKVQVEKKLKPFRIPLAHPLIDPRTTAICLITKDPQREYKDLLEANNINFISRVVGIQKLKGKFKPFEARRMLLKENGLFLADERVVPLLPKLLGKPFFSAKKQPLPVCLTRKELKAELERAVSSTYFHQNQGTCSSVKFGTVGFHDAAQLFNNLKTSLPLIIKSVKGGWDNIQSIHIKTSSSVSLPIWTCELSDDKGGRWEGLTAVPIDAHDEQEQGDEKEKEEKSEEVVETKKGKKRQVAAGDSEQAHTRKQKKIKTGAVAEDLAAKPNKSSSKNHLPTSSGPSSKIKKKIAQGHEARPTSTKTHTAVPSSKREKKPRPSAADFLEPHEHDPVPKSSTSTIAAKKKGNKGSSDASLDISASGTASKHPTPVSPVKDKGPSSPTKTKALVSGIDKKKARLIGLGTKSKVGQAGRNAKHTLLRKKAAAP